MKIGPRVASQRNSLSENPESNIRNSRVAMSPQPQTPTQGQGQGQGQGQTLGQVKAVKVRSFSGALRTFDENFERNSCKAGDDNSDGAVNKSPYDMNNILLSSTIDAVFYRSLDEKLLALDLPAERKKRNTAEKYLKSLGMSEGMPFLREEGLSSLSANLGIFNTIPSKGMMLPFVDRRATSLPSDGGKNVDFGSDKSQDSDGDADNDNRISSNDSLTSDGEESEKVRRVYSICDMHLQCMYSVCTVVMCMLLSMHGSCV
jgi:hypothetical protein